MILKLLLLPFTILYGLITALRHFIYTSLEELRFKPNIPVICLGNISVGGSGKTPLGLHLVGLFKEKHKVGVLLRGYKSASKETRPLRVTNLHGPMDVGDEAALYKTKFDKDIEVVISPNRKEGINFLESLGVNLIIMDDGLQHFKVKPSLSICIIEVSDLKEINNPNILSLLPSGRLREWPSQTLSRSDLVIFTKKSSLLESDNEKIERCLQKYKIKKSAKVELLADKFYDAVSKENVKLANNSSASLFSTIARPALLLETLKDLKIEIQNKVILPDHTPITKEEWLKIQSKLIRPIICTEKDLIKIHRFLERVGDVLVLKQEIKEVGTDNFLGVSLLFPIKLAYNYPIK